MERSRDSCNPFDRKINPASNLPLNNWRNDAWVPVVPFTPRNFRSSLARRRALSSIRRSWSHNVARFPTVVSCAGWRWVYPNVGNSRYIIANLASRDKTLANFGRRMSNPWRRTIKSLIIKIDKVYRRVFRRYFFFHIYIYYRVVTDVATCRPQMDYGSRFRALVPENVDVGHHVVSGGLFFLRSCLEVDIVRVGLHFRDLFRGNGQAQLLEW